MADKLNALFLFLAPGADSSKDRGVVDTPGVRMNTVAVLNYEDAEKVAVEFVENNGVDAIEVCAGFGHEGIARLAKVVKGKAYVGAVRFDFHPNLGFKSGDDVF